MRLLNTDRNDANILVRRKRMTQSEDQLSGQRPVQKCSSASSNRVTEYELVPIDHGYCLPQYLEVAWCDWCWYQWPQLRVPLSEEDRTYILSLDPSKDMEMISQKIPLRAVCRRNFLIASMVVQKGVRGRVSLYEIARLMCREDLDTLSDLEKLCLHSFEQLLAARDARRDRRADMLRVETSVPGLMSMPPPRSSLSNGLQSPPGFWASQKPTHFFGEHSMTQELDRHSSKHSSQVFDPSDPSTGTKDDENALGGKTMHTTFNSTDYERYHTKICDSYDVSEEFDAMNNILDGNTNDEKLFLSILSKSLDEAYDLIKSNSTNLSSY